MAYSTTPELLTLLQAEVGDSNPSTATTARFVQLLDTAHKAIVGGGGELNLDSRQNPIARPYLFSWAKAEDPISITLEPKQTGSATVTQDSTSVTVDINSATKDLTGWHIRFNNQDEVYRISAHSGTTVTLRVAFSEESASGLAFDAFKLIYDVAPASGSMLMPSDSFRVYYRKANLSITGEQEMLSQFPLKNVTEGNPRLAGLIRQTSTGLTVQMSHYPKKREIIELPYIPVPETLDTTSVNPIIPNAEKTRCIVHLAAFYHLRKRDDNRALSHLKSAQFIFDALKIEDSQIAVGNDAQFGYISPFPGGFSYGGGRQRNKDVDNLP